MAAITNKTEEALDKKDKREETFVEETKRLYSYCAPFEKALNDMGDLYTRYYLLKTITLQTYISQMERLMKLFIDDMENYQYQLSLNPEMASHFADILKLGLHTLEEARADVHRTPR